MIKIVKYVLLLIGLAIWVCF